MPDVTDTRAILRTEEENLGGWNAPFNVGVPVIVSYRFVETPDLPRPLQLRPDAQSAETFPEQARAQFRKALEHTESVAGVVFVETDGPSMIDVYGVRDADYAGRATLPLALGFVTGDGFHEISFDRSQNLTGFQYEVVLHELGHNLGLEHPFEGRFTLPTANDSTATTLMSYTDVGGPYATFRGLDREALIQLYGPPVDTRGWRLQADDDAGLVARGSARNDVLYGLSGENTLSGRGGKDLLLGRESNDVLKGHAGRDELYGFHGNDMLRGGGKGDLLEGGNGADTLQGGGGNDYLISDQDDPVGPEFGTGFFADRLVGGAGRDTLQGNNDPDVFVFSRADLGQRDLVIGFDPDNDTLRMPKAFVQGSAQFSPRKQGFDTLMEVETADGAVLRVFFRDVDVDTMEAFWSGA